MQYVYKISRSYHKTMYLLLDGQGDRWLFATRHLQFNVTKMTLNDRKLTISSPSGVLSIFNSLIDMKYIC